MAQRGVLQRMRLHRVVVTAAIVLIAIFAFYHHHSFSASELDLANIHHCPSDHASDEISATTSVHAWSDQSDDLERRRLDLDSNLTSVPPIFNKTPLDVENEKKKGETLLCYLDDPLLAGPLAVSRWTDYASMEEWGWQGHETRQRWAYMSFASDIVPGLGVPELLLPASNVEWYHWHERVIDGTTYPITNGQYINVYWPDYGILMANDNAGPAYQVEKARGSQIPWEDENGHPLPLPELRQWSDVNYLTWKHLTNDVQRRGLKWIFQRGIINKDTQAAIEKITTYHNVGDKAPEWPGLDLTPGSFGFEMILASPNLRGVMWLLIQHQADLGKKKILRVRMWRAGRGMYAPNLVVELGDASGGDVEDVIGVLGGTWQE
ncbi:hypothetical protein TI39_contig844g00038 [Zymoseptoria brevis]|uniref:Uncharacterized protein n=1 Tax=Zymoseptoria brevis TaxID=1047168 RepID=A0A0F4GF42_9PEZI|nr:hypothetical protein TI39_contig844g00038 [Zymoseptoria brevis]